MANLDGTDLTQLGTGTAQGAATGFTVGGPVGALVGGGLGFLSSLAGVNANNQQQAYQELQAERAKLSAIELNKARELEQRLIGINKATQRRQMSQQNLRQRAQVAAAQASGSFGGTAIQSANATLTGNLLTNFQTNLLTEAVGADISDIRQEAANIAAGVSGPQMEKPKDPLGDLLQDTVVESAVDFISNPNVSTFSEFAVDQTPIGLGSQLVNKLSGGTIDKLSGSKFVDFVSKPSLDKIDKPSLSQFGNWLKGK